MLNFVGIGAQKSGTSWLYEALSKHSSIDFPGGKEVHYWDAHLPRGLNWYRGLFGDDARCNGDITPAYAILPVEIIRRMRADFPTVKLIYLLRNPLERAWSAALMAVRRAEMEYAEASDRWFIDHFHSRGSLARGDYASCLENWLSVYPRQSLLIARYEEIVSDPVGLVNRVLGHIGVDECFTDAAREELSRPVFEGDKYEIRPALRAALQALYADKIDALSALLDCDFSAWKTMQR